MALRAGTHLGPYEILSLIGAGGQGEVYKASDTRLNRTVAIKVLAAHFAENPEMKQRFEREARTIAGLNHPHICTLYDVGNHEGAAFLVMEYLEGETLAQRLQRGPIPLEETFTLAIQIADALDTAHRAGVVHRDLKPANVMLVRNGAKLLDFGLAKLTALSQFTSLSEMPTRADLTADGTILGTFQYMAPEQLESKDVDARTDLFAFGAVLYEMITGRKAFEGKSQASLIGAIMTATPEPVSKLQPMTPPALDHVVKTCLAKDPEQRWQTARDLSIQLKWIAEAGTQVAIPAPVMAQRRNRERLSWALLAIAVLLVIVMAVPAALWFRGPQEPGESRFLVSVPPITQIPAFLTISPDGQWIAFVASASAGSSALFVRPIDSVTPQEIAGTNGATSPFWSPDSRAIAFFAFGKLQKVDIAGGLPQNISAAASNAGGTWNSDGIIIFGSLTGGLQRVSVTGGAPVALTDLDLSQKETAHSFPISCPMADTTSILPGLQTYRLVRSTPGPWTRRKEHVSWQRKPWPSMPCPAIYFSYARGHCLRSLSMQASCSYREIPSALPTKFLLTLQMAGLVLPPLGMARSSTGLADRRPFRSSFGSIAPARI